MAKSPKKRDKKGTKVDFKKREVSDITNHCYQRVKFMGDCFHDPRAMGIQKLWTHLKGPYHELGLDSFLRHIIRTMDWSMVLVCYFKDKEDPERIHAAQTSIIFRDFNMEEVSQNLSAAIIEGINRSLEADERFTNDTFIYYAYLLMPEFHESHFTIADGLSALMINLDDISEFKPFHNKLVGRPTDKSTLPNAIKNNGIYPTIKKPIYFIDSESHLEGTVLHKEFENHVSI